ncbi:hypothetical protein GCM10022226_64700 [Sphaerisporangium flaviroseum]|uniref:FXSXX-COOH protein n=1 Tax=Sphaerisporangium flaviroseum TaxID=509199 RepID=A0ABP7J447_9ACTN
MTNEITKDTKSGAASGVADVRKVPLASLSSFAEAGLLDQNNLQMSSPGVKVAAFNSSI